ncbi:hypothetical protein ACH5RR_005133 [Cinchona calisaya]|uniref:Pulmonary surfactant-associated protein B n=1 Tax=Cinchona calisaya TaxID=153742 RepID=A0ABD3AKB8_9GENT
MDARVLLFLFLLSNSWRSNARELATTTNPFPSRIGIASVIHIYDLLPKKEVQTADGYGPNAQVCTLCEEFADKAVNYLANNETQTEILEILHKTCSKMHNFKQQCITLVDYYAPLFFLEISSIQPEDLCRKVDLCEVIVSISSSFSKNSCDLCHTVVTEAITKLKDPDTQLEIIEVLLKACDAVQGYVKKCKRLVFEYAPAILVNTEQFLETKDICTMLHACDSATTTAAAVASSETSKHAAS